MYFSNSNYHMRHHNPLLHTNHTYEQNFLEKNLHENKEMIFKNGVINIEAAAYNGAPTVN